MRILNKIAALLMVALMSHAYASADAPFAIMADDAYRAGDVVVTSGHAPEPGSGYGNTWRTVVQTAAVAGKDGGAHLVTNDADILVFADRIEAFTDGRLVVHEASDAI